MDETSDELDLYRDVLGSPKYVVAPMVDASELAWRQLSRRYGADLCYTPMFHSAVFVRDAKYRKDSLQTCPEDRPLIVQFCANDPQLFLQAARLTVDMIECDAIDLNLGCPQIIAKRGHFGSYLQDEWELIKKIISLATSELKIPITAKCRVFPELDKTIRYAQMLESAGAKIITVHGRTREQRGPLTGLANWDYIKAVKESVSVPVFANGNIQFRSDADRCMEQTGVNGVMSAEGNLTNPAIFAGKNPPVWDMAIEYLDLVDQYPCPNSYVRGHLFKMMHHCLQLKENFDIREIIAKSGKLEDFREGVLELRRRYIDHHKGDSPFPDQEEIMKRLNIKLPPWICQPYVRQPPDEYKEKMAKITEEQKKDQASQGPPAKRLNENGEEILSKRKQKKMEKNPYKTFSKERRGCALCVVCKMPAGLKCAYQMCRKCCKEMCIKKKLDCEGHKMFFADKKLSENRNDTKPLENLKSMELTKNISNKELDTSMDSALTEKNSADIS